MIISAIIMNNNNYYISAHVGNKRKTYICFICLSLSERNAILQSDIELWRWKYWVLAGAFGLFWFFLEGTACFARKLCPMIFLEGTVRFAPRPLPMFFGHAISSSTKVFSSTKGLTPRTGDPILSFTSSSSSGTQYLSSN